MVLLYILVGIPVGFGVLIALVQLLVEGVWTATLKIAEGIGNFPSLGAKRQLAILALVVVGTSMLAYGPETVAKWGWGQLSGQEGELPGHSEVMTLRILGPVYFNQVVAFAIGLLSAHKARQAFQHYSGRFGELMATSVAPSRS